MREAPFRVKGASPSGRGAEVWASEPGGGLRGRLRRRSGRAALWRSCRPGGEAAAGGGGGAWGCGRAAARASPSGPEQGGPSQHGRNPDRIKGRGAIPFHLLDPGQWLGPSRVPAQSGAARPAAATAPVPAATGAAASPQRSFAKSGPATPAEQPAAQAAPRTRPIPPPRVRSAMRPSP